MKIGIRKRICLATPMICVIIYLILGFVCDLWHPGWVVFFLIPIVPVVLGTKTLQIGYPLFCLVAYLIMGFIWDLWHPGWIIFLTIPVFATLFPGKKLKIRLFGKDDDIED